MGRLVLRASLDYNGLDLQGMEAKVIDVLPDACEEAMKEFHEILGERVESQRIGGPPLKESSVEIKKNILEAAGESTANADQKWRLFDKSVNEAFITKERQVRGGKAELSLPPEEDPLDHRRTLEILRTLEEGGWNERGDWIDARPLVGPAYAEEEPRIVDAFAKIVNEQIQRSV